ncbi:MAG: GNAT family N-acetyltransferase [Pirellulales bacterium]|nr:GNAT family N-acetyltransferase [Pirellulales bacterium]
MPSNLRLRTPRLELVAAMVEMLQADLAGREKLSEALGVEVPAAWPPINWEREPIEYLIDWMQRRPDAPGWFAWYCILRGTGFQPVNTRTSLNKLSFDNNLRQVGNLSHNTLIGGLGFLGPPSAAGESVVGYSLLADFHRQGYCPEALSALLDWAFSHAELKSLLIRTLTGHRPSIRVAEKLGFEFAGPGPEPNTVEYALDRAGWMREI